MKYVMIETEEGAKFPFIFPESLVHSDMAEVAIDFLADARHHPRGCVSAGFVHFGNSLVVSGHAESLNNLPHKPVDAARILLGETAHYLSDAYCHNVQAMVERNAARDKVDD